MGPRSMPGSTTNVSATSVGVGPDAVGTAVAVRVAVDASVPRRAVADACVAAGLTGMVVAAGPQADSRRRNRRVRIRSLCFIVILIELVVWRFFGNDHIMRMAFDQACVGNAGKADLGAQVFERCRARVAHPRAQSADELID